MFFLPLSLRANQRRIPVHLTVLIIFDYTKNEMISFGERTGWKAEYMETGIIRDQKMISIRVETQCNSRKLQIGNS